MINDLEDFYIEGDDYGMAMWRVMPRRNKLKPIDEENEYFIENSAAIKASGWGMDAPL